MSAEHPKYPGRVSFFTRSYRVVERWNGKHPLFSGKKIILRARRVLAERLGRSLGRWEDAHHKNEDVMDDSSSNVLLKTRSSHMQYHRRFGLHEAERAEKIRTSLMGHPVLEETRRKLSAAKMGNTCALGHIVSTEARERISKAKKGVPIPGHPVSAENRVKLSTFWKGNKNALGYKHTKEAREKMRVAWKRKREASLI